MMRPEPSPIWLYLLGRIVQFLFLGQYLFVGSGLVLVQIVIRLLISLSSNRTWRGKLKSLSSQLTYIIYSPGMAFSYYFARAEMNFMTGNKKVYDDLKNENMLAIIVTNHSFTIDYIIIHLFFHQLNRLTSVKLLSKHEVMYLPIAGWIAYLTDTVFVKRDWSKDCSTMGPQLNELFDYDSAMFALYAEGTRFTNEKYLESVEYAKSNNIQPLKHHLMPKARGFVYTLRHLIRELKARKLEDKIPLRVYNLECLMPYEEKYTIQDYLGSRKIILDFICEEIKISNEIRMEALESQDDVNCSDCPKIKKLLMDIYRRKDTIVEEYKLNGNMLTEDMEIFKRDSDSKEAYKYPFKPKLTSLFLGMPSFIITYATFGYLAFVIFVESKLFWYLLCLWPLIGTCVFLSFKAASEIKRPK